MSFFEEKIANVLFLFIFVWGDFISLFLNGFFNVVVFALTTHAHTTNVFTFKVALRGGQASISTYILLDIVLRDY